KWRLEFRNFKNKMWYGYYKFLLATQGRVDDRFRKFFRAGYFTVRNYIPNPYPERTLVVRTGLNGESVGEPKMGWEGLLDGKSDFQFVPGGHRRIFLEENVDGLAAILKRCLTEAQNMQGESELATSNTI